MAQPDIGKSEPAVSKGSSTTVTVACKLPHGLVLKLYEMVPHDEPVLGGGTRTSQIAQVTNHPPVVLKGYLAAGRPRILGGKTGYALTHGVNREFFEEWLRQNADLPAVKQRLIFASDRSDTLVKRAMEATQ